MKIKLQTQAWKKSFGGCLVLLNCLKIYFKRIRWPDVTVGKICTTTKRRLKNNLNYKYKSSSRFQRIRHCALLSIRMFIFQITSCVYFRVLSHFISIFIFIYNFIYTQSYLIILSAFIFFQPIATRVVHKTVAIKW